MESQPREGRQKTSPPGIHSFYLCRLYASWSTHQWI
jgi:hypothetical protein